ncbi:MAG: XdhC family protein [bacterium]|jgi:xanthine/CO dehydrogenase XdhC/CoxF family maturation factor|nr:MAG: sulfurylase small subunit [bacterium]
MDEANVYRAIVNAAGSGRPAVLATVVRARGSTPRSAGSKMLIDPDNGLIGTIGGGCGEAEVLEAAREVARTGEPRLIRVELTDPVDSWSPAVCGGVMEVFLERVTGGAAATTL